MNEDKLKYACNVGGFWKIQTLQNSLLGDFGAGASPDISISNNGIAHIIYRGEVIGIRNIHHIYKDINIQSKWINEIVTNRNWYNCHGMIGIDKKNNLHLIYTGSEEFQARNETYYLKKVDDSLNWSQPELITKSDGVVASFIIESDSFSHILWEGTTNWFFNGILNYVTNKTNDWESYRVTSDSIMAPGSFIIDNIGKGHIVAPQGLSNEIRRVIHLESLDNFSIVNTDTKIVNDFELFQNYPNPFNPTTTISFYLKEGGTVTLRIFDILGKEIVKLIDKRVSYGKHFIKWNAEGLNSGIYFYNIIVKNSNGINKFVDKRKMLYLK